MQTLILDLQFDFNFDKIYKILFFYKLFLYYSYPFITDKNMDSTYRIVSKEYEWKIFILKKGNKNDDDII